MTKRIAEAVDPDSVNAVADAVAERLHEQRPLHELPPEEFKARAAETWRSVFADADKRVTFPRGTVSVSDYLSTGGNAA